MAKYVPAKDKTPEEREAYNRFFREYRQRPGVRDRVLQRQRDWNQSEHGQKMKKEWHLHRYSLTSEEFDKKLQEQGGVCAICKTPEPGGKGWCVDHDHVTGKFRGVLCMPCNSGLGHFRENPASLLEAIEYIRRTK